MEKRKVISKKILPTGLPIQSTITIYLLLDKLNANTYVVSSIWTIVVIYWLLCLYVMANEEQINFIDKK